MSNYSYLAAFTLMLSVGQLLFKKVGLLIKGLPLADGITVALSAPALYIGLALYGVSTVLWIWILSKMPLAQAYPWVGVAAILVPLLGMFVYDERVTTTFWFGAVFVAVGIILIQLGSSPA